MKLSDALDQIAENISDDHPGAGSVIVRHLTNVITALELEPLIDAEYDVTPIIKP